MYRVVFGKILNGSHFFSFLRLTLFWLGRAIKLNKAIIKTIGYLIDLKTDIFTFKKFEECLVKKIKTFLL